MQHYRLAAAVLAAALATAPTAFAASLDTYVNQGFASETDRAPAAAKVTLPADYQNPAEVRAFYNRIKRAAYGACNSNVPSVEARRADDACTRKALADAVATVAKPTVTALYQSDRSVGYASGY
jgi:UrcA family protein